MIYPIFGNSQPSSIFRVGIWRRRCANLPEVRRILRRLVQEPPFSPCFLGLFGSCPVDCGRDELFWSLALTSHAVALSAPVAAFAAWSLALHGETGLRGASP